MAYYCSKPTVLDLNEALSSYLDKMVEQKIREMVPEIMSEHCKFYHKKRRLLLEKMKNENG